jgi:hypothetical protein
MREKNFPLLVFLLGLTLGLIGGGAVVYFAQMNEVRNKISVDLVPDIVEKVFGIIKKNEKTTEAPAGTLSSTPNASAGDSNPTGSENASDNALSLNTDSLGIDSLQATEEEMVVLQRDELVSTGSIEIINLDFRHDSKKDLKSDSLLAEVSEVKPEVRITETRVSWLVEYWSSPVNYKGYRIGKNKFILFGIDPDAPLKAYLFNGNFFLKSKEGIFELDQNQQCRSHQRDLK